MIKIYTCIDTNMKNIEMLDFVDRVKYASGDSSKVLEFPEISKTMIGWSYPTSPLEIMGTFYDRIYNHMNKQYYDDLYVITLSTLVFDTIRLAAKNLKLRDAVEIYDEKLRFITSVNEKGRLYKVVPGLFDAEEQTLFRLVE